jgi:hypothetical protein
MPFPDRDAPNFGDAVAHLTGAEAFGKDDAQGHRFGLLNRPRCRACGEQEGRDRRDDSCQAIRHFTP